MVVKQFLRRGKMKKIDGGYLVAEALKAEGVKYIFSVSGGVLNPIYNACEELGIQIIHTRHEAAAAFMADGWARTTGSPGVVITTLGPGMTNVITGIFTAYRATSPIIVISGQATQSTQDLDAGMSVNPLPIVSSITKWAKSIPATKRIPEYISGAFRHATSGRPGPVFLELPSDVIYGQIERDDYIPHDPETSRSNSRPQANINEINHAIEQVTVAKRPIAIAGSGSFWSGTSRELQTFVEKFQLPFFLARGGRGVIPEDHSLCFGPGYIPANPVLEGALKETDLLLLLGHRLDFDLNFGQVPFLNKEAKIIQVDIEASEIGRYRPVHIGIASDLRSALSSMTKIKLKSHNGPIQWLTSLESERNKWELEAEQAASIYQTGPMHPLRFLREISKNLPKKSVLITSHGNIDFWADAHLKVYQPGGYLRAGQSGSLGAEIPYGVAAKLARPEEPVVVIVGDGGFGYHCMELDTAARYGAPLIIAIGNDAAWGAISLPQERTYGRAISTDLEFRNYERISEVLGGYGEQVDTPEHVSQAMQRALESKLPSVLNVRIASIESRYMYEISK
jgi:acetolactate synthase I/II/III large subunit